MAAAGKAMHATIDVAGHSSAEVAALVAATVAADGHYSCAGTGPDAVQLVRTYRPTWAIALGVVGLPLFGLGVLFLLVHKTESCTLTVVNGPTGAVLAVAGVLLPSTHTALREALSVGRTAAPGPVVVSEPAAAPPLDVPTDLAPPAGTPAELQGPSLLPACSGSPVLAPGVGASSGSQAAAPSGVSAGPPSGGYSDDGHTIFRSALPTTAEITSAPGRFWLKLPEGRVIDLTGTTLLGRDPAPPNGGDLRAVLVPLHDPSMQVSKTHLALRLANGALHVEDLHSTNGTVISDPSGSRVMLAGGESAPIKPGTFLEVGGLRIEVGAGG